MNIAEEDRRKLAKIAERLGNLSCAGEHGATWSGQVTGASSDFAPVKKDWLRKAAAEMRAILSSATSTAAEG